MAQLAHRLRRSDRVGPCKFPRCFRSAACLLACRFYHLYFASRDDTAAMDAPHAEVESRVLSCIKPQFRAPVSFFAPRPCHICTGTGLTPATSAPGLGSPPPHLHRDWANPCHICAGNGLTPATSAPGLGEPLPHLRRDWAHPCHICTGTGLAPATSAPGLGAPAHAHALHSSTPRVSAAHGPALCRLPAASPAHPARADVFSSRFV